MANQSMLNYLQSLISEAHLPLLLCYPMTVHYHWRELYGQNRRKRRPGAGGAAGGAAKETSPPRFVQKMS
ncbi:hypothetical protein OS493_035886 [Desmophyllum pertusum]|uniref:Uncharacterized protein n=1 Tax=Desmophyllum pertusum TaxID=174260 RepID=A0A9X0D0I3_9CNID|nr:hypothetical protein OS493_035886 [Desmophyllum pertusum]